MADSVVVTGKWKRWQDWAIAVLALWIAISPAIFFFAGGGGFIVFLGIVLLALAIWTLSTPESRTARLCLLVLEVFTFITPWIFGFASGGAGWNIWICSIIMIILSAPVLSSIRK